MACLSCGGVGTKPGNQIYTGTVELSMIQYFESIGWKYQGLCGCRENYKVYTNAEIPTWQVWVHAMGNSVQFRRVYSPADIVRKGMAGLENYKQGYDYWVLNSEKQVSE